MPGSTSPRIALIVTCEHGGNRIPRRYAATFADAAAALHSHRGYDPGSLPLARRIARSLDAPLFSSTISRLLVELNRTLGRPRIFSEFSRRLPAQERERLIERYYRPYRAAVTNAVAAAARKGRVVHLSVHSFTPVLNGQVRRTDVGLLFDPRREWEAAVCDNWRTGLLRAGPGLNVHRNLPYRGTSDGFVVALRQQFAVDRYAGIELEVNQKYPQGEPDAWRRLQRKIVASLAAALAAER